MYIGDDVTDEDAFRAINSRGVSVRVGRDEQRTAADYAIEDPAEVAAFLEDLLALAEKEVAKGIWALVYDDFNPEQEGLREALCTLGNGYFATRGAAPESEADDVHYPGTYVGGCYNRLKTEVNGNVVENESLVNAPNWLPLTFKIENGEWFDVQKVELLDYRQELDLMRGVLTRLIRFADKQGRQTRVSQRRFVSMDDPHLAGLETTIVAENWSGVLQIRTGLDGRVANTGVERYRQLNNQHLTPLDVGVMGNDILWVKVETNQSHIKFAEAARTRLFLEGQELKAERDIIKEPGYIGQDFLFRVQEKQAVTVEKGVALFNSRDRAISECLGAAQKKISRAPGFESLLQRHVLSWDHLWGRCRIDVKADTPRVAQVLNLHIFHLLQTVSIHSIDLDVGVPPRGLHGEAYRGHIMWDELFIFPFLTFRIPDITRALLQYRYRRLGEARWAAKQAGYQGALYPWMSGSDGREEAQTLHLNPRSGRWIPDNSQLQRHINIAIAYNVWHYYQVTGDIRFLSFYGAEMLFEIARFWASMTEYNRTTDRFDIRRVMGPDEFHDAYPDADEPGIDNNAYTNVMVVWLMCRALETVDLLPKERREPLLEKLALRREELEQWDQISRKMMVAFHDDGIISQFEGYDQLKEFDWKRYRKKYGDIHRLDRILEAEGDTPNRYKVSKQADVLMLFYLLSADELRELFGRLGYPFEYETIPKNLDYYIQRTSHGSTLSRIVHSWVLSRSERELSWHLFKDALESDIADIQGGTTEEGIHLGAMAGTVDQIQRCYTGGELSADVMWLNPHLPEGLREVQFDVMYRQHWVNIQVTPDLLKVSSSPSAAAPIKVGFEDRVNTLKPGQSLEFELK